MKIFSIFIMLIGLANCGFNVEGRIFLDENANLEKDNGEDYLAGLPFKITLDDTEIATGFTDASGYFKIDINELDTVDDDELSGEYCIVVDSVDLQTSNQVDVSINEANLNLNRSFIANRGLIRNLETDCDDGDDDDNDGLTDDEDPDCDDSSSNSNNNNNNNNSSSSSDSSSSTASVESGRSCDTFEGGGGELDVPIAKNYEVVDGGEQSHQIKRNNPFFTIDFAYPEACDFLLLDIPSFIEPVDDDIYASAFTRNVNAEGEINLNQAVSLLEAIDLTVCDLNSSLNRDEDLEKVCPIQFQLIETEVLGDESATFTPTVRCPDDTDITLQEISVSFDGDDDIDIDIEESDNVSEGDNVEVIFTITNNTATSFTESQVDLSLDIDNSVVGVSTTLTQGDGECDSSDDCSFSFDAEEEVVVTVNYTLPANIEDNTDFDIDLELNLTFEGNVVTFEENQSITVLGTD
jgi:hypothetical protein